MILMFKCMQLSANGLNVTILNGMKHSCGFCAAISIEAGKMIELFTFTELLSILECHRKGSIQCFW